MVPSSIENVAGCSSLTFQPAKVLPSKSETKPSGFEDEKLKPIRAKKRGRNVDFFMSFELLFWFEDDFLFHKYKRILPKQADKLLILVRLILLMAMFMKKQNSYILVKLFYETCQSYF